MFQLFNVVALVVKDGCRKANPVAHRQGIGNLKHLKVIGIHVSQKKSTVSYKVFLTFYVSLDDKNK